MTDRRLRVVGVAALAAVFGAAVLVIGSESPKPAPGSVAATTATSPSTTVPTSPSTSPSTSASTSAAPANACTDPNFTTSSHDGGVSYGSYYVTNNMWNPLSVRQTLHACSYDSWYVDATMTSQGGAVQTYPNSQMTFANKPKLGTITSLSSSFGQSATPKGPGYDYEYAYDIWINGYGGAGTSELMIWTYDNGQSPGGTRVGTFDDAGRTFDVYLSGSAAGGDYIAFVPGSNVTSGSFDLVHFFGYALSKGWIDRGSSAKLWQVDYGVEICSTAGHNATFDVTSFDVNPAYG